MIFRFILISDEKDDFMREIQIDADATFLDFHKVIMNTCNYKEGEMTTFTMCENGWEKMQEITLEEMDTSADQDSYVMADTRLGDFIDEEKQHIIYTFDPLADRCFFIEVAEIITGKSLNEPKVSRRIGDAPVQALDFDALMARNPVESSTSILEEDDEMFGDGIDDAELGDEGLDITEGNPYE